MRRRRRVAPGLHGGGALRAERGERPLPGELVASGTLPDGSGMETGTWLRPGDALRLVIEDVGEVVHAVA